MVPDVVTFALNHTNTFLLCFSMSSEQMSPCLGYGGLGYPRAT